MADAVAPPLALGGLTIPGTAIDPNANAPVHSKAHCTIPALSSLPRPHFQIKSSTMLPHSVHPVLSVSLPTSSGTASANKPAERESSLLPTVPSTGAHLQPSKQRKQSPSTCHSLCLAGTQPPCPEILPSRRKSMI